MSTVFAQTKITNMTKSARLLRWVNGGGEYLSANGTPGDTVIVDGLYPSACKADIQRPSAYYDIEQDLVKVELITNLPGRAPTAEEMSTTKPQRAVQRPVAPTLVDTEPPKTDERWDTGKGIESMKPEPITLPGHDETLTESGPKDKAIFAEGPSVETPTAAEADVTPEAPAETSEPVVEAPKKKRRRKAATQS